MVDKTCKVDAHISATTSLMVSHGMDIEGPQPNTYSTYNKQSFIANIKWFEPAGPQLLAIELRITTAERPVWQILQSILNGSQGNNDPGLRNAANTLGQYYINSATVDDFWAILPVQVRTLGVWSDPSVNGGTVEVRGRYD